MGPAWVPHGPDFCPFPEASLSPSATEQGPDRLLKRAAAGRPPPASPERVAGHGGAHQQEALEGPVQDLAYIGLTILVFAALYLLVKGVERFER
jgi:hypothetical protein